MAGSANKSLKKIKLGDLKIAEAEVVQKITTLKNSVHDTDKKIAQLLAQSKETISDFELESLARETSGLLTDKKSYLMKLEVEEKKKLAIKHLIQLKEESVKDKTAWGNICHEVDITSLEYELENNDISKSMDQRIAERIIDVTAGDNDYSDILSIIKSVKNNETDLGAAKSNLDELVKSNINNL